jgi:hypothetical protein
MALGPFLGHVGGPIRENDQTTHSGVLADGQSTKLTPNTDGEAIPKTGGVHGLKGETLPELDIRNGVPRLDGRSTKRLNVLLPLARVHPILTHTLLPLYLTKNMFKGR